MEIIQGTEYIIIRMPENLSVDAVDGVLDDCCRTAKTRGGPSEYLVDMEKIPQLHRAGLVFIQKLHEKMTKADCTLSIAGLTDAVENALRFQHVDEKIPLYKTIIDFERQRELDFDFTGSAPPEEPPVQPSPGITRKKLNIMVLDPSIANRNNQKLVLNELSPGNLIEASDPQEAVKRLRSISFPVDVLIADFEAIKPILSDFVRTVRTLPSCKNTTMVMATVDADEIDKKKSSLGIDRVINKNYTLEDFLKVNI